MGSKKIKVGVIGAGGIATLIHIPAYQAIPGIEVVAVADVAEERAQEAAAKFAIPQAFADFRELLALEEVQAVSVCTPNYLHAPITIAALSAGKHVLCEKPMALTTQEAQAMVAAAERAGRKLMVGFHNRFKPNAQALKRLVEEGRLGNIYYGKAKWLRRQGIPGFGTWFTTKALSGGGALWDIGVHALDMALWMMGFPRPVAVSASTFAHFGSRRQGLGRWAMAATGGEGAFEVEDTGIVLVRFAGGASLLLEASWASYIGERSQFAVRIFGTEGGALLPLDKDTELELYFDLGETPVNAIPTVPESPLRPHFLEVQHFIECIREDREPLVSGREGLETVRIMEAAYQSGELGREVQL